MSLKHAILGYIDEGKRTGYDLQKNIAATIGHFWPSTQSQIYRSMKDMQQDGWIEYEWQIQEEKPNKKIISITETGREELMRWLTTSLEIPGYRNPFLVQMFFSKNLRTEEILSNLENYQKQLGTRLSYLSSEKVLNALKNIKQRKLRFIYDAIRENGLRILKAEIDWVETVKAGLQNEKDIFDEQ